MRKNFGAKPIIYPQPVLIIATYDENETPDAMNAAWGGICDSNKIYLSLSFSHKTVSNIKLKGAFTVSIADAAHIVEADYVGIVSANKVKNKLEQAGLHTTKSELVDAPIINELLLTLECKVFSIDEENEIIIGEIVNVSADESILNESGNIAPEKLQPISFDPSNNAYLKIGEKVGNAFSDGKKLIK